MKLYFSAMSNMNFLYCKQTLDINYFLFAICYLLFAPLSFFPFSNSLTKNFLKRPTPEQILSHPFIVESSKRSDQEVNVRTWIENVWDFKSPTAHTPKYI